MPAKRRVSAKQRLELVQLALDEFNNYDRTAEIGDYTAFVERVEYALQANLTPRNYNELDESPA